MHLSISSQFQKNWVSFKSLKGRARFHSLDCIGEAERRAGIKGTDLDMSVDLREAG
jgi:hypothetical protein